MADAADAASDLLKALANPHRLMILCHLTDGERTVSDLAALLGLRVSTLSQHLALLRRDGMVTARRVGQTVRYSVSDGPARLLVETLADIYCTVTPPAAASPTSGTQGRQP